MSLVHAILGMLNCFPATGYELKTQSFDGSIAHFWPADQAQIYRTLDRLAEQGWAESHLEIQQDRPNRKVYQITEAGRAELRRWLLTEQPLPVNREPFLIQLFFGADLANAEVSRLIEAQIRLHRAKLAVYEAIPLPSPDDPTIERDTLFQRFTLELGLRLEHTYLEWLDACLKHLADHQSRGDKGQ